MGGRNGVLHAKKGAITSESGTMELDALEGSFKGGWIPLPPVSFLPAILWILLPTASHAIRAEIRDPLLFILANAVGAASKRIRKSCGHFILRA